MIKIITEQEIDDIFEYNSNVKKECGKKAQCICCGNWGIKIPAPSSYAIYKDGFCHQCLWIYNFVRERT